MDCPEIGSSRKWFDIAFTVSVPDPAGTQRPVPPSRPLTSSGSGQSSTGSPTPSAERSGPNSSSPISPGDRSCGTPGEMFDLELGADGPALGIRCPIQQLPDVRDADAPGPLRFTAGA